MEEVGIEPRTFGSQVLHSTTVHHTPQGLKLDLYLRNEFHFSGVHGAMNPSGSRAK